MAPGPAPAPAPTYTFGFTQIDSSPSFSELKAGYVASGQTDAYGNSELRDGSTTSPIIINFFRNSIFTNGDPVPTSGSISVNTYFKEKTFTPMGTILADIRGLALKLNTKDSVTNNANITSVVGGIHDSNECFNVFAVVGRDDISESLSGTSHAYNDGRPTNFDSPGFYYNSNNFGYLSTGSVIKDFSGGSDHSLSAVDGKKWMAMALYSATTFKGILIWVFTDSLVNNYGTVITGTRTHTRVANIFGPNHANYQYSQIHPIVIDANGTIIDSSTNGTTGWAYSTGQNAGPLGYYSAAASPARGFSYDDGCWGFRIKGQVQGNDPGPYLSSGTISSPSYGIINPNSGDAQSSHYWDYSNSSIISNNTYVGFAFSGDNRTILDSIIELAPILNGISSTASSSSGNIGTVVDTIHDSHGCFNVFAVVGAGDISELLAGTAHTYNNGRPTDIGSGHPFNAPGFFYNSNYSNYLSTGNTIKDFSGGSNHSLSAADGKKWMAMAMYSAGSFKGILIWVFTNSLVNDSGNVISGSTRTHNRVADLFYPDHASYQYSQIHPIVIDENGTIIDSSTNGKTGWAYSSNQQPNTKGYYATSGDPRGFSFDDGCWGIRIEGQVQGNSPGPGLLSGTPSSPSYGIINPNSNDAQNNHYWDYSNSPNINNSTYVGFVFSGDNILGMDGLGSGA